jgi:ferritin-like metal-binding protein YciE
MGWFSSDIDTFDELFVHTLQDIYYAEHQIKKSLPDMVTKASDAELKKGFRMHLKQTDGHIKRLDRVFKMIKSVPQGTKCPAIDGILEEASEIAGEIENKTVLNAALIAAAQAVEHYEITRYGTLTAWAKLIGRNDVETTVRVHDECNGSDVFGSDICTCRPYLVHGIEECIKTAQRGGIGYIVYFRKEGRALGEVTKFLVYNARKRQKGGDSATTYFHRTECVAGVQDARFQQLMPDVIHWLGLKRIDRFVSMSDMT